MVRPVRMLLSAMLFAAVVALWARSHFAADGVYRRVDRHPLVVRTFVYQDEYAGAELTKGALLVGVVRRGASTAHSYVHSVAWHWGTRSPPPLASSAPEPGLLRFGRSGTFAGDWVVRVPFWFLTLLAGGVVYAACVRPLRASRRAIRAGRCPRCGYDLRGSAGHCPECGARTAARVAQQPVTAVLPNTGAD
jgi:hypothetical protein